LEFVGESRVVILTLLYIYSEVIILAKAGIQFRNNGFRVKPGMTNREKGFLTRYAIVTGRSKRKEDK
jgi:hypothetical protein